MRKRRLALIAAVVIALVCVPFVFLTRPSRLVELHFMGVQPVDEGVNVFFEVRNRPPNLHRIVPLKLEAFEGAAWKEIPGAVGRFGSAEAPTNLMLGCVIDRRVHSRRLRLVTRSQISLNTLESFIERVKLRLSGKGNRVPINPFAKNVVIFSESAEVISEEFTIP
jgi:hypothetical protein